MRKLEPRLPYSSSREARLFAEWLATRPKCVRDLAGEFPPGAVVTNPDGDDWYIIGYTEDDRLTLTPRWPTPDDDQPLAPRTNVCADHLREGVWSITRSPDVEWKATQVPTSVCPFCDHELIIAAAPGRGPKPGDFSVCIDCASALRFNDDLTLRAMTREEFLALDAEAKAELERFQRAVRAIDRREPANDADPPADC